MLSSWIDDSGRRLEAPGADLGAERAGAALKALGYAALYGNAICPTLMWCPGHTTWAALNSAANIILNELRTTHTTLRYYINGWREERVQNSLFFHRLDEIDDSFRSNYLNYTLRISDVPAETSRLNGQVDRVLAALKYGTDRDWLTDNHLILSVTDLGRPHFANIGSRTMFAGLCTEEERRANIGQDCAFDPARNDFGPTTSAAYLDAIEDGCARYDRVTARLSFGGRENVWVHYDRVTLPIPERSELFVLTTPAGLIPLR